MGSNSTEPIEHCTVKRRVGLVVSILKMEIYVAEAARQYELAVGEVEGWR